VTRYAMVVTQLTGIFAIVSAFFESFPFERATLAGLGVLLIAVGMIGHELRRRR
jgi:hypothetical protein